jgi:regulator of protease activity HflC (stomatin/prohibitin superfamily)
MFTRLKRSLRVNTPQIVLFVLFFAFMLVYMSPRILVTIPAGHEAVLYRRLAGGTVVDRVYHEGLRFFFPWDTVTLYNVREQVVTVEMNALTSDGLDLDVRVTVRFQPRERLLGTLHKEHGPNYIETFLKPEIESSTRNVLGRIKPVELYSSDRNLLEDEINRDLNQELRQFGSFNDRFWPKPPPITLGSARIGNDANNTPNILLILKHLYEMDGDLSEKMVATVQNYGFVRTLRTGLQQEADHEAHKLFVRRDLAKVAEKMNVAERELSMSTTLGDVEQMARYSAAAESLRVAHDSLLLKADKLIMEFRKGNEDLDRLKKAYDDLFTIIELKDVLISRVALPPRIKDAIEAKLAQEQIAQEFDFRLERERKEAERKRIEARGIRDFQHMVSEGIKGGLLKWKAIEATLALARSQNAKMIVIGAGEDGLPVILGNQGWDFPKPTSVDTVNNGSLQQ